MRLLEPDGVVALRVAAIGDVGVVGRARAFARREGYDRVLAAVVPSFRAADLAFANLEFPVGEPALAPPGGSSEFWHEPEVIPALVRAGAKLLSLANNHMMDLGPEGLARTRAACERAGLAAIGAGRDLDEARRPATFGLAGKRVVALAYAAAGPDRARPDRPGVAPLEPELLDQDLKRWRDQADLLVVSVHWGSMYVDYPPPRVLELARQIGELADLVLGHHPHVTQGFRRSGRSLMLFSLGDACFDARAGDLEATVATERRRETGVFTALVAERPGLEYQPLTLDADGIPRVPDGARAAMQERRLRVLSAGLEEAEQRFAAESAPVLLRYELESLAAHLRRGRLDRVLQLLSSVRPRHLPVLWQALRRMGRAG